MNPWLVILERDRRRIPRDHLHKLRLWCVRDEKKGKCFGCGRRIGKAEFKISGERPVEAE
jgi:hypothetical protein